MSEPGTREAVVGEAARPIYVVWELTLKCDLACRHCGSRAGVARARELDLAEATDLARQLAALGTREVTFIGGEAYLHPEWQAIVAATAATGIRCTLTTGGRAVTAELAAQARAAGIEAASVSIDGLAPTHDRLRAVPGSHRAAVAALANLAGAGIEPHANTQVNRLNLPELEDLAELLVAAGVRAWQVQLTGPMGRAADHPDWLLQPHEMLGLVPRLGALARALRPRGTRLHLANNLGYYGPWEIELRSGRHWQGCVAGRYTLGIEADGAIKGCPSLPTAPYVGGNVRERPLAEIWEGAAELAFAREDRRDELWGYCAECYYADTCQGGCSWTAHTLLGRRGNMPYCFHRAESLAAEGWRERLVQVERAPGEPFDFGRFSLVREPFTDG